MIKKKIVSYIVVVLGVASIGFTMKKDLEVIEKINLPKEIEVKIRPTEDQLKILKRWLKKNAEHKGIKHQKDVYVDNPQKTFTFKSKGFIDAYDKLRVRFEKGKENICYKYRHIDSKTNKTLSCDELEFPVGDNHGLHEVLKILGFRDIKLGEKLGGQETLNLLKTLGFTKQEFVEKDRDVYLYKGFEIVIDDVKNLGVFVEVEIKTEETETKKGIREIYDLFKLMGLKKITQFDRSYLHMLWNPGYDFSEEVDVL